MKMSYDKKSDVLSRELKEGRGSRDDQIAENVFAGFDREGNLLEIQILEISKANQPWMTLEMAAKYLGKSERTLLRWIKAGKIKPKKVGREYKVLHQDLKKLAS